MQSTPFNDAFEHAMLYEVGRFWDSKDPDVIQGRIETREQRRKVGFVNIRQDRGGETKYGIAQRANPNVNVRQLNLAGAVDIYERNYWRAGYCDKLPPVLASVHFDACVNHGPGRACQFLQRAAGVAEDKIIGRMTLVAVAARGEEQMIRRLYEIRHSFYNDIVRRDKSQSIFLRGWLIRVKEVTDHALHKLV